MKRITALILILALTLCACSSKTASQWQEQYDLGMKYLGEGQYALAIDAFTAAIEIDPEQKDAYTQRAEAYLRLARQLSDYLTDDGDQEMPALPADPPSSTGLAIPQNPDATQSANSGNSGDSQELNPPGDLPTEPESTQPRNTEEAPGQQETESTSPTSGSSSDFSTEPESQRDDSAASGKKDHDRLRDLIKKYLNQAKKDYEQAKDLSPEDKDDLDDKIDDIPSLDDLIPENPEPNLNDLIDRLDYAMILAALEGMGCYNVQWEIGDPDADGDPELLVQADANMTGIPSQLTFDVRSGAAVSFTATGAAQSSNFVLYADGSYGFYTGYHTAGNSEDHFYSWNGSGWSQAAGSITDVSHIFSLPCPNVFSIASPDNFNATCVTLENDYTSREGYLGSLQADFEGDGVPEQIYLLRYAGRNLLSSLRADNAWGDEAFLTGFDNMGYAIIVSQNAGETLVTVSRIDIPATDICYVDGSTLVIGDVLHDYDSETHALSSGEVIIADNILDFLYFQVAIPDSWEGRYVYEIYEEPYLDGIPATYYVSFYESAEHQQTGGGLLVTIALIVDELGGYEFADADLMGIFYYGSPANPNCLTYSVYAIYPSDVPFSEENADTYLSLSQDIYNVLLSFDVDTDYFYFHSYYTDTH